MLNYTRLVLCGHRVSFNASRQMEHTADNNNTNTSTNTNTTVSDNNTNATTTGLRRSMFERRNRFTLRLGRRTAIPVILALHDPKSFNEVLFQTILSLMKDKIIKYLQYDPYHGQLRVTSDLPGPHNPVSQALHSSHHMTLLYYFTPHDPPAFVVRNTSITVLRTGPALGTTLPNKESEEAVSNEAEQFEAEEHVEDDERSWHSLHADDDDDEGNNNNDDDEGSDEDVNNNNNDDKTGDVNNNNDDTNNNDNNNNDDDEHVDDTDDMNNNNDDNNTEHHDDDDWDEHVTAQHESRDQSAVHESNTVQHVRGYESLRLLSHVLVLETVSAEHSLTHLLSQQSRDSSAPVHHLSRYFQQPTQTKKRKSVGKDSARGRKKAKK